MIFIIQTASPNYNNGFIDPINKFQYINEVEAAFGHEACKKIQKKYPDRIFLGWWEKKK